MNFRQAPPEADGVYWTVHPPHQFGDMLDTLKLVLLVTRGQQRFVQYFKHDFSEPEVELRYTGLLWGDRLMAPTSFTCAAIAKAEGA